MNKPRLLTWGAVLMVVGGLAAAVSTYLGRPVTAPVTRPAERLTIAISHSSIRFALILIAAETGYFRNAGLDVTFQTHTSGRDALAAALDGRADLATVAETPLVLAIMRGQPVSIVATVSYSGLEGIIARKDRRIAAVTDLKGKRIGAAFGTTSHYVLDIVLLYNRVPLDQISMVNINPEKMAESLVKGELDAIAVWEPYLSEIREAIGDQGVMFQSHELYRSTFNIAGRREYVAGHAETIRKLMSALLRAEKFVKAQPAEAKAMIARITHIPESEINRLWPQYSLQLTLDQTFLALLDSQARWAIRNGMVKADTTPNFLEYIYWDALAATAPSAVTIIR